MKIAAVFTGGGGLAVMLDSIFKATLEDCQMHHISDDGLLGEIIRENCVTDKIQSRVHSLYQAAMLSDCDLILCTCSSIGETIETAGIPAEKIMRIDEPMARKAVAEGSRIGVIATLGSTMKPTCRLLEKIAAQTGKTIAVEEALAGDMLPLLMAGKMDEAIAMAKDIVAKLSETCDVVVLAQASMAAMEAALNEGSAIPVYASPALCAQSLVDFKG